MKISEAAKIWIDYHVTNSKKNTVRAYRWIINKFCADFGGIELTPTLQKPEGFRVKATEGDVVVFYFEPSATQNLKSSGFPEG